MRCWNQGKREGRWLCRGDGMFVNDTHAIACVSEGARKGSDVDAKIYQ